MLFNLLMIFYIIIGSESDSNSDKDSAEDVSEALSHEAEVYISLLFHIAFPIAFLDSLTRCCLLLLGLCWA